MYILYQLTAPKIEDFAALFETTGWNLEYRAAPEELGIALHNSWLVVSAFKDDRLVGVGRVVSDGVMHAMIYDLIVHPDYQCMGIGSEILFRLTQACLDANIRDIQLFCARGKRSFYEQRGFFSRPEDAPGMQFNRSYGDQKPAG
jgi:GNAT superfamily N-acetyltransferase